jgi:beta-phosphoglucomutase-like phosphatase (HAD superfamily)
MTVMQQIRAIIFDFNGVLADDETSHLLSFQQALAEHGLSLTKDEYYGTNLGMDERTRTGALLAAHNGSNDPALLQAIMQRKALLFSEYTAHHTPALFPGVVEFVKQAGRRACLAIVSGGRRDQIDSALSGTPIEKDFVVIVSADDISIGKPDSAIYNFTLKLINGARPRPRW